MADVFIMNIDNIERMRRQPDTASQAATIMRELITSVYVRPVNGGWEGRRLRATGRAGELRPDA
jgi:hypothetical protein